jgi:CHASE3 domain sensor protein
MADGAPPDGPAPDAALDQRVGAIETKLDMLLDVIGKQQDGAHGAAQDHMQDKLDRPTTVAEEIRAQLDERDRKKAADDAEAARNGRLEGLETKVRDLAETKPAAPVRRVEKLMGWQ